MKLHRYLTALALMLGAAGCVKDPDPRAEGPVLIDTSDRFLRSNLAGNLITTAMQKELGVDIVFYPSEFLPSNGYAIIDNELTDEEIDTQILPIFPSGDDKDTFRVGTLRGSEIREFILNRTNKNYRIDVQVAGVEYNLQYEGGMPTIYQVTRPHGMPLENDAYYRVAISNDAYFSPFPGYRYGNSFENIFNFEPGDYSAQKLLKSYLQKLKTLPLIDEPRATISMHTTGVIDGLTPIPEIQGESHLSPYRGKIVTTSGIITAAAVPEEGGSTELYIQTDVDDNNPLTSNAVNVNLNYTRTDLVAGTRVQVTGTVYEVMTAQGLTRTAIREVTEVKTLETGVALPTPIMIGVQKDDQGQVVKSGRVPPLFTVSSYRGNINQKGQLNLNDGLDFWESLEGMRIEVARPTAVGFRGGWEKYTDGKGYLTLFVRPEGASDAAELTAAGADGGLLYDPINGRYNPQVIRISDNDLAPNFDPDSIYVRVGDKFKDNLVGIMSFQTNIFGDGEFSMYVTGPFQSPTTAPFTATDIRNGDAAVEPKGLADFLSRKPSAAKAAAITPDADHVTIGTFNVENLSAVLTKRIAALGNAIGTLLNCPDILNMPEIQDNNGVDFSAGSAADKTLSSIIANINCPGSDYRYLNIDPIPNNDGGEPGGNIRVAMLYNAKRVDFVREGNAGPSDETFITRDGHLNQNPGRLFPNEETYYGTRKPLVAEFSFKGQSFFVIGVHLNSKLGDTSPWAIQQPVLYGSEVHRGRLTTRINQFVSELMRVNKDAKVMVLGDFNAYWNENSMKILAGQQLTNLMTYGNLVDRKDWYSTNYDGNAAAIDHVFVSNNWLDASPQLTILHINSDFMFKLSDHDPVIARFKF